MNSNKSKWLQNGYAVFSAFFLLFWFFLMMDPMSSGRASKLGLIPGCLKLAPELFSSSLAVESRDFPVEEMKKTKSWGELQNTVSRYDQGLELMINQNRKLSRWVSSLYLISAIGMAVFAFAAKRSPKNQT